MWGDLTHNDLRGRILDSILAFVFGVLVALSFTSCERDYSPTAVGEGCRDEDAFCRGKILDPLSPELTHDWQTQANLYVVQQYGPGNPVYPEVTWHPCFFSVDGICAAGWTSSPSNIHISTAEPDRTGPLVAHETLHAIYWKRFGDPDARHKRPYGW